MLFAIACTDRPAGLRLRLTSRFDHLTFLERQAGSLILAGPLQDTDGRPSGSLLLIDASDRAEAERFAAGDAHAKAGSFRSTIIRSFQERFRN